MRPRKSRYLVVAAAALAVSACGTTHLLRPVGRGNTRVNLSSGGPIVVLGGKPIPVPMTTVGLAHGVSDSLDAHVDAHPFSGLFQSSPEVIPVIGMDLGLAYHPIPGHRQALTVGGTMYGFTNRRDAVVFTDVWFGGGTRLTSWFWVGGGLHNVVRLVSTDDELNRRPMWSPTLFAQLAFRPFSGHLEIDLEGRWYAFTENGFRLAPNFVPIGQYGALGFMIAFNYQFGGVAP